MLARSFARTSQVAGCSSLRGIKTATTPLPSRNWGTYLLPPAGFFAARTSLRAQPKGGAPGASRVSPSKSERIAEKVREQSMRHREAIKERFPEGWNPPRKLSREAMDGLRTLHAHDPQTFSTPVLAEKFRVSSEAVRRILKSRWTPSRDERARLLERERKRKDTYIAQRIERERQERWDRLDSLVKPKAEGMWEKEDRLTLR